MFEQVLIEFWLNQNTMDSVTSNVLSHGQVRVRNILIENSQNLKFG